MIRDISIEPGELPLPPVGSESDLVYHYAGVSGLKRINEGPVPVGQRRLVHERRSRSALYGFHALGRTLQAFASGTTMESDVRQAALDRLATMENKEDFLQSCSACLSTKRDDLSRSCARPCPARPVSTTR